MAKKIVSKSSSNVFEIILSERPLEKFSVDQLAEIAKLSVNVTRKKLNQAFAKNPKIIYQLTNFVPRAESLLSVARSELGCEVTPNNFLILNKICKKWLDDITNIVHRNFLKNTLEKNIKNKSVVIDLDELNNFLLNEYSEFMLGVNNSLVSLTGTSTENIIIIGLESSGLLLGNDFFRKGKGFDADLKIVSKVKKSRGDDALFVEVKSFYAKERFSVALSSIKSNCKVGVGFFVDHREFNPSSTKKYLEIGVMAIYMPDETYNQVDMVSKQMLASHQSNLYRPISIFCSDMKSFNSTGLIPKYTLKSS